MEEMEYEYLLRRVYHCGRNYSNGADADVYRAMERAYSNLQTKVLYSTQEDREYEFRKQFAKVRNHVDKALVEGLKQIRHTASEEETKRLEKMRSTLLWDFYDKDQLDEIISKADNLFQKYGLES